MSDRLGTRALFDLTGRTALITGSSRAAVASTRAWSRPCTTTRAPASSSPWARAQPMPRSTSWGPEQWARHRRPYAHDEPRLHAGQTERIPP
jgi:hypothetical protein